MVTRRGFLTRMLVVGVGVFVLSQIVLLGSLGPRSRRPEDHGMAGRQPARDVRRRAGDARQRSPRAAILVAFPEGHTGSANSQVALLRIADRRFKTLPGRETWSPEGYVAYSRVCTHAGCSVAQYEDEAQVLVCPCHQSTFDLLDGAQPVAGPAGRPLPQLPLAIDAQGYLVAQSDFTVPVGPGFWNEG